MKKKLTLILSGLALAGGLCLTLPSLVMAEGTNAPAQKPAPNRIHSITFAISSLEMAKKHLETAKHDFGGHKKAAIEACDKALAELQQAMIYDENP